jgi:hypothetical protein
MKLPFASTRANHISGSAAFQRGIIIISLVAACACFWIMRIHYWRVTSEEPFSDMADYLAIADGFRCCWSLSQSDFWQTYAKPTLPAIAGLLFSVTGGISLDAWRIALALATFLSVLWLARELYLASRCHLYSIALIGCVAVAKSSIFWSLKFATEGLGEAFIYLVCAALLCTHRTKDSVWPSFILGMASALALLNRPNLVLVMPLIFSASTVKFSGMRRMLSFRLRNFCGLALGCSCVILPLAIRTYSLYGTVTLSPTQGPYSFLWELGAVPVTLPSGEQTTRTAQQLQEEAPRLFANDLEASSYAKGIVRTWIVRNWNDLYPKLIRNRFFSTIQQRDIALSRVPRTQLFPGSLERVLIDKSPLLFALGSIGLILLALRLRGAIHILPATALLPWGFGILFMGDPRMLEPSIPLILFGCAAMGGILIRSTFKAVTWFLTS